MVLIPRFLNVSAVLAAPPVVLPTLGLPTGTQEGPRMTWDITTDLTPTPNQGTIDVYNLGPLLAHSLKETWEATMIAAPGTYKVLLSIGWEGLVGLVATMDPYEIMPEHPMGDVDTVTRIIAGDGGIGLRDGTIGVSLAVGDFSQMLAVIAVSLKAAIEPASLAVFQAAAASAPVQIFESFTMYGDPKEIMDQLMESLGLQWWVLNSSIVMTPSGLPIAGPPVVLAPQTGLLTWSQEADGSIKAEAMADVAVIPGVALTLLNRFGIPIADGVYRAFRVRYVGDTDSDSRMTILAKKALIGF